jgi:cytochrome d ubiquinol oxidase subunit II
VLWLLMLRGVAIELRSYFQNAVWASFWDGLFALGSTLLVFCFGAALANVVRGVSLDRSGFFFEPLWTNVFNAQAADPGFLDWYTVLIGLLALAALTMHGASYLLVKTEGPVRFRARRIVLRAWGATVVLTILGTIATFSIRSTMLARFNDSIWGYTFPLIAMCGLIGVVRYTRRGRELPVFLASSAFLAGMLASIAFGLYPNVLPATHAAYSLTIHNAAAGNYGLTVGLVWWIIAIALALISSMISYRLFRGKVRIVDEVGGEAHLPRSSSAA